MHLFLNEETGRERLRHLLYSLLPIVYYMTLQFGTMILTMFAVFFFRLSPGSAPTELTNRYSLWSMGAGAVFSIVFLVWLMQNTPMYSPQHVRSRRDGGFTSGKGIFCVVLLAVCGALFGNVVITALDLFRLSGGYETSVERLYGGGLLLQAVVTGLLVPAAEELLFRGALYNSLRRWLTPLGGILLSAAAFGLYHGNLIQGVYGFLMGILFAWIVERSGDLTLPILMHSSANLMILFLGSWERCAWIFDTPTHTIMVILLSGTGCLGCIYGIHRLK